MAYPELVEFENAPLFGLINREIYNDDFDREVDLGEKIEKLGLKLEKTIEDEKIVFSLDEVPVLIAERIQDSYNWKVSLSYIEDEAEEDKTILEMSHLEEMENYLMLDLENFFNSEISSSDSLIIEYISSKNNKEYPENILRSNEVVLVPEEQDLNLISKKVKIIRKGLNAYLEGEENPVKWLEIVGKYARLSEDGEIVCFLNSSLSSQIEAIEAFLKKNEEKDLSNHVADIKALRKLFGNPNNVPENEIKKDLFVFDMLTENTKDIISDDQIKEHKEKINNLLNKLDEEMYLIENDYEDSVADVVEEIKETVGEKEEQSSENSLIVVENSKQRYENLKNELEELIKADPTNPSLEYAASKSIREIFSEVGIGLNCVMEVRNAPLYYKESIRSVGRDLLSPFIGDIPMEKVSIVKIDTRVSENYLAFNAYFEDAEVLCEFEPLKHKSMPDYQTSNGKVYRKDEYDFVVFSDFDGQYAYVYPSNTPENKLNVDNNVVEEGDNILKI